MWTSCDKCGRGYNDESCWTICPHGPLEYSLEEYCPKCDTLRSVQGPCRHQQKLDKEQMMDLKDYVALAMRTEADQDKIHERNYHLGTVATRLNNAVRGMAGDVGEVNTCVQNWLEYNKPLDHVNLKEELGDVLWRIAQVCFEMGWTLEEVCEANLNKLKARYPEKYSDEQADPAKRDKEAELKAILWSGFILGGGENPTSADHQSPVNVHKKNPSNEINEMDVREQNGQGWSEPPTEEEVVESIVRDIAASRDGFAVARDIVNTFLDGKNADIALGSITIAEKKYKGGR